MSSRIAGFDTLMSVDYQMASARAARAVRERDEALNQLDDTAARDRDETRRLLYMAAAARLTTKYNLVGTLANALLHHSHLATDVDATITTLCRFVEGHHELDGTDPARDWVLARLAELNGTAEDEAST